jgi:hypothetical protein
MLVVVWDSGAVDTLDGPRDLSNPRVVWRGSAGTDRDLRTGRLVRITHDPIVYEAMESTSTVYWWEPYGFRSALVSE